MFGGFYEWFNCIGSSYDNYLDNMERVLERWKEKWLVLNWEKFHFITISEIVLGHVVSFNGIKVDRTKVKVILKLDSHAFLKMCKNCQLLRSISKWNMMPFNPIIIIEILIVGNWFYVPLPIIIWICIYFGCNWLCFKMIE